MSSAKDPPGAGVAALAARGDAQFDAAAVAAGEQLHVEHPLADLGPLAHQRRPTAADAADPKVLDAERLQRSPAAKAAVRGLLSGHHVGLATGA